MATADAGSGAVSADAKRWGQILAPYGSADPKRSVFELLVTGVPFVLLCGRLSCSACNGAGGRA